MNRNPFTRRRRYFRSGRFSRRRRNDFLSYIILVSILVVLLAIAGWLYLRHSDAQSASSDADGPPQTAGTGESLPEAGVTLSLDETEGDAAQEGSLTSYLQQAELLAAGYDYDAAIELLNASPFAASPEAQAAVAGYEEIRSTLVRTDPRQVTHVFFHTLIMDTSKAFDGDSREKGYNQMMTTKDEFLKILQAMYDRGFVLVRLHDLAYEVTEEDGTVRFKEGDIMLPPGKQAFVMSQDDVCYYEYMEGDGFASRMIVGEDGRPTCEMKMDDGSVSVGAYDLVPLLDQFIDEHPDFSYRGAKAVIAFTGYNGILGYRTAPSYDTDEYRAEHPGFDYAKEREEAARVAQCLKDDGYELASHSWGHRNMGEIPMENFIADTDKWEAEVETLTGPCDIILFPFGSDIGDWHPYAADNERFQYLHSKGFRYFCNVDSARYFVQIGDDYLRQGRRNLDGYRMYYDLPESGVANDHLSDLFNVSEVFDRSRPTPVPKMSE